jgi:cytochrome P450/glutathione S-transferase
MISIPISPFCEMAKWALDRLGVEYYEECHAPVIHAISTKLHGAGIQVPVVVNATSTLPDGRAVVAYYDARARADESLFPADPARRKTVQELYDLFCTRLGVSVRAWAYAYMLPIRELTIPMWRHGVGRVEHFMIPVTYPLLAYLLGKSLGINDDTIPAMRADIHAVFDQVEDLLKDGRPFLTGDTFTAADLAFVVMAAPTIQPEQYDCPMPSIRDLPFPLRSEVEAFRQRPAGQFVLRVYKLRAVRRAVVPSVYRVGFWANLTNRVTTFLLSAPVLRPVCRVLRSRWPVLSVGRYVVLTRNEHVREALAAREHLSVEETNGVKFAEVHNEFVLGMNPSPQHDRELELLHHVVLPGDLPVVGRIAQAAAADLLAPARTTQKVDVVQELARPIAARVITKYFGLHAPNEQTLLRWLRQTFWAVLGNTANDPKVAEIGKHAADELARQIKTEIEARRLHNAEDDVINRMVRLQKQYAWLDDDTIRRNIGGLVVGAAETISKYITAVIDELLRRPSVYEAAAKAARDRNSEAIRTTALELARFNPPMPLLLRYSSSAMTLSGNNQKESVAAGRYVVLAQVSAMFDERAVKAPANFQTNRKDDVYLHFGYGLHECVGKYLAQTVSTEVLIGLLGSGSLERAPGHHGKVAWEGPFPDSLVVQFTGTL